MPDNRQPLRPPQLTDDNKSVTTIENQPAADTSSDEQTPEQRAEARRYNHISLACTLADMAIDLIYLGLMAFVFARPLDSWLARFPMLAGDHSIVRLIALFVIVMLLHILVSLP